MTEAIYLEVAEKAETAHKAGRRVSVSGMWIAFFSTSRASCASRSSRFNRAIYFASSEA